MKMNENRLPNVKRGKSTVKITGIGVEPIIASLKMRSLTIGPTCSVS